MLDSERELRLDALQKDIDWWWEERSRKITRCFVRRPKVRLLPKEAHDRMLAEFEGRYDHGNDARIEEEGDIKLGWIPAGDDLICKIMLARHDEERMVVVANRHPA